MRSRRVLFLLAGFLVAILLAFFLQDVVRRAVITPLAYLWWVAKLVYRLIPELVLWILLLIVLILSLFTSLMSWFSVERKYERTSRKTQGAVETLATWIRNSKEGNYYKWLIANRLGKLAHDMHIRLEKPRLPSSQGKSETADQDARATVLRYLKAGLDESFANYPLPQVPFVRKKATPFDLNVDEVVEFLESQMEVSSGTKHS